MYFLKTYQKCVASFVTVCFITSFFTLPPAALAQPTPEKVPLSFVPLGIPRELASVEEVFIPDPKKAASIPLIHIQSVHAHAQTQKKIYSLLKLLDEKYGINALYIEGAGEQLNPDYFRFFDDHRLNIRVAEKLLEKGELTGAELFLIESQKKIPAYGLEDPSLYRENLTSFQNVMTKRPLTSRFTGQTHALLDRLETLLLSPPARKLLRTSESFDGGRMELLSYTLELERRAKEILELDLRYYENQLDWPQLIRLLRLQELESKLEPENIQSDREKLTGFLKQIQAEPELVQGFENLSFSPFQAGMVYDPGFRKNDLPRYLAERLVERTAERGFSFDRYPYFSRYLEAAILQSELEAERLFGEMEKLFETLIRAVSSREEEWKLVGLVHEERLLERLFNLEFTPKDYAKLEAARPSADHPLIRLLLGIESLHEAANLGEEKVIPGNIEALESVYGEAVRFYELAKAREEIMVEKILSSPSRRESGTPRNDGQHGLTILITGGFHTDGLSRQFRKKGISYTIVSPRITEKVSPEAYVASLLGEKKTAFDTQYLEVAANSQRSDLLLGMFPKDRSEKMEWNRTTTVVPAAIEAGYEARMPVERFLYEIGDSLFFQDRRLVAKPEARYVEISSEKNGRSMRFPIGKLVTETNVLLPSIISERTSPLRAEVRNREKKENIDDYLSLENLTEGGPWRDIASPVIFLFQHSFLGRGLDTDDLYQEAFLALLEFKHKRGREGGEEIENAESYIRQIIVSRFIEKLRQRRNAKMIQEGDEKIEVFLKTLLAPERDEGKDRLEWEDEIIQLMRLAEGLPEDYRRIFLAVMAELDSGEENLKRAYGKISEKTQASSRLTPTAVKMRFWRARQMLLKRYDPEILKELGIPVSDQKPARAEVRAGIEEVLKVLLVDDEPSLQTLNQYRIMNWAAQNGKTLSVDTAEDLADARKKIAARHYDFVLSDLEMPEDEGLELARSLKESSPETIVTLWSSNPGKVESYQEQVKKEFGPDFKLLNKPLRPQATMEMIFGLLESVDAQLQFRSEVRAWRESRYHAPRNILSFGGHIQVLNRIRIEAKKGILQKVLVGEKEMPLSEYSLGQIQEEIFDQFLRKPGHKAPQYERLWSPDDSVLTISPVTQEFPELSFQGAPPRAEVRSEKVREENLRRFEKIIRSLEQELPEFKFPEKTRKVMLDIISPSPDLYTEQAILNALTIVTNDRFTNFAVQGLTRSADRPNFPDALARVKLLMAAPKQGTLDNGRGLLREMMIRSALIQYYEEEPPGHRPRYEVLRMGGRAQSDLVLLDERGQLYLAEAKDMKPREKIGAFFEKVLLENQVTRYYEEILKKEPVVVNQKNYPAPRKMLYLVTEGILPSETAPKPFEREKEITIKFFDRIEKILKKSYPDREIDPKQYFGIVYLPFLPILATNKGQKSLWSQRESIISYIEFQGALDNLYPAPEAEGFMVMWNALKNKLPEPEFREVEGKGYQAIWKKYHELFPRAEVRAEKIDEGLKHLQTRLMSKIQELVRNPLDRLDKDLWRGYQIDSVIGLAKLIAQKLAGEMILWRSVDPQNKTFQLSLDDHSFSLEVRRLPDGHRYKIEINDPLPAGQTQTQFLSEWSLLPTETPGRPLGEIDLAIVLPPVFQPQTSGQRILNLLYFAIRGERTLEEKQPVPLLTEELEKLKDPKARTEALSEIATLSAEQAQKIFSDKRGRPVGVPLAMELVASLSPDLLGQMHLWNPEETYQRLKTLIQDPPIESVFKEGDLEFHEIEFRNPEEKDVLIFSRVLRFSGGEKRIFKPFYFKIKPLASEEDKFWFEVSENDPFLQEEVKTRGVRIQVFDHQLQKLYPKINEIRRENPKLWSIGVPRKWGSQTLERVEPPPSPIEPVNRAEVRSGEGPRKATIEELYEEVDARYFKALRGLLFQSIEKPTVFVPASGSDITSILLSTNAVKAVLVNQLPFGDSVNPIARGKADEYFAQKKALTWNPGYILKDAGNLRTFVVEELKRIGVPDEDVNIVKDAEDPETYHVHFKWPYPGEAVQEREFVFTGGKKVEEITEEEIQKWLEGLQEPGFDGILIKGGEYMTPGTGLKNLPRLLEQILPYLKASGSILSEAPLDPESVSNKIKSVEPSEELVQLEKEGAKFGYDHRFSKDIPGIKDGAFIYQAAPRAEARLPDGQVRDLLPGRKLLEEGSLKAETRVVTPAGTVETGFISPMPQAVGFGLLPAPFFSHLGTLGVRNPRAELRVNEEITGWIMNAIYAYDPKVGPAILAVTREAVNLTMRAETRLAEVGAEINKVFPLLGKRSDQAGVVLAVFDQIPTRSELRAALVPALMNRKLRLVMAVAPGKVKKEEFPILNERQKEARELIADGRADLLYQSTWEEFDETLSTEAHEQHQRLMPAVTFASFIEDHFILSLPQSLSGEHLSRIENKVKGIRTVLDNIKVGRDDPRYPAFRLLFSTLTAKLAQNVLSRIQEGDSFRKVGSHYWPKDSVFEAVDSILNIEAYRRILAAA